MTAITVERELFAESPRPGVGRKADAHYVSPSGVEMVVTYHDYTRSNTVDYACERRSADNGKTWGEPREVTVQRKTDKGVYRIYDRVRWIDPATGRLIRLSNRALLPTDHPGEGGRAWNMWYEVSADGARTFTEARPVVGDQGTPEHPFPAITIGQNGFMLGDQTCVPIAMPDGSFLCPFQFSELDESGKLYQPYDTPFYAAAVLVGRWKDAGTISWSMSGVVKHSADLSTRGAFEPTIARVPDGRILMLMRGSNAKKREWPGRRWYSISSDDGRTWSEIKAWHAGNGVPSTLPSLEPLYRPRLIQTDGTFYSPASCSQLITHSSGRLFWIGNISPTNPDGNLPRYPMTIGEVDTKTLLLKPETVTIIDDKHADDNPRLCLSNFYAHEDRVSGQLLVYMPRWFAHTAAANDWTSNSYRYRIRVT